ncbi:MAG: glycosyltransferase [Chloroflexota bacterium]
MNAALPRGDPADSAHRLAGRALIVANPAQLPPFHSGGAQVLSRMLRPIVPSDYVTVSFGVAAGEGAPMPELPGKRYRLDTDWSPLHRVPGYPLATIRSIRLYIAEAARRGKILAEVARRERCASIVATSSSTPDFIAATIAARLARIPLAYYLLDDWSQLVAAALPAFRNFASFAQPWLVSRAAATMVISPLLAVELERDYAVAPVVVNHPLPYETVPEVEPVDLPWPHEPGRLSIVFTGRVYDAHYDSLISLLGALELPGMEGATLHVYTASTASELEAHGVRGRMILHAPVPGPQLREIQRDADILLLPLGFATPYPEIVRTAVPTKTAEYLAAGRPILVHAPANSYLATLATRDGAAAVVSSPDPAQLADAIRMIAGDADYRRALIAGALRAALKYHSPEVTTARFRRVLDRIVTEAAAR